MKNIIFLGLVSFFSDISSELVYPLIPLYLTSVFGATPALVGVVEGIAESLASLLKVFSGYITDKYKHKKQVAFIGYAAGLVYKAALFIASSWAGILAARVIDRIGKGIRTAPRDVLVSESAEKDKLGRAFGIHKALDMAGSAVGILAAYFLLKHSFGTSVSNEYKKIFIISVIPAVLGLFILTFVKEKKMHEDRKKKEPFWRRIKDLDFNLRLYLAVSFVFTLGNSSNAFLLLKAKDIGFNDTNVVLLYLAYNLTAALLSVPFGRLSDKIGRKKVLVAGYLTFTAVYMGFAFVKDAFSLIAIFVLYGFFTAMTAGVERALISEIAPPDLKGTMLGMQSTLVGFALLPASIIAGLLWNAFGPVATFAFGAFMSLCASIILTIMFSKKDSLKS